MFKATAGADILLVNAFLVLGETKPQLREVTLVEMTPVESDE